MLQVYTPQKGGTSRHDACWWLAVVLCGVMKANRMFGQVEVRVMLQPFPAIVLKWKLHQRRVVWSIVGARRVVAISNAECRTD
jgi:hypothetical protein